MNQTKKILAYLGCIAFTILGVWLLTIENPTTTYPLWTIRVAGILSIIFFGGGGLFMAYKKVKLLINHKKEIEFTDRGISICGAEEILWNEIADFSLIRFKGNRLITIQMKDSEKVIANESSWIKRKTMEYNLKTINALYSFPAYMLDGQAEEALALCKQKLKNINNITNNTISSPPPFGRSWRWVSAMHDIIRSFIGLTLVHIGAALRFIYHRFIIRDKYSYHSLITESPVFDCSKKSYKEQFEKWKQRQIQRNQAYDIDLNEEQQQTLEMLLKEGRSKKEIIQGMIETGELKLIDIDIYPRNPEYFSNRVLDGIIGLCFLIILILIIHYI